MMKKISFAGVLALTPVLAFAQSGGRGLDSTLKTIGELIGTATPIVVALALLYFFWGLAMFILNAGDEDKKNKGRAVMIWGIIALFIIVSVWGLIGLVQQSFGISGEKNIPIPSVDLGKKGGR